LLIFRSVIDSRVTDFEYVQSLTLSHFGGKLVYLTERPSLLSDDADDDLLPGINNLLGTL